MRAAVLHAWGGYKQFAWGMDELQPISQQGQNVRVCVDMGVWVWAIGCMYGLVEPISQQGQNVRGVRGHGGVLGVCRDW